MSLLLLSYILRLVNNNLANNQSCQNIHIELKERLQVKYREQRKNIENNKGEMSYCLANF
jgi:hypothetical protein